MQHHNRAGVVAHIMDSYVFVDFDDDHILLAYTPFSWKRLLPEQLTL